MNIDKAKGEAPLFSIARSIAPWLTFWAFFAYGWRVRNPFTHIPAYGDVLEVLWGIEWYHNTILIRHSSPFFTSLVFHPLGRNTGTMAYTPFMFVFALPFYVLGGVAFAYNAIAILALVIGFAGAFRFLRLYTSEFVATVGALIFLAMGRVCFLRVGGGHINIAWLTGLLAWLAWAVERARRSKGTPAGYVALAGIIWGVMLNFCLYGVFIGATVFSLWGSKLFRLQWLKRAVIAGLIAIVIGLPTLVPYLVGRQQDHPHFYGIEHNMWWGASLNSLLAPNVFHPLPVVRSLARSIYAGPTNESGVMNMGLVTSLLVLVGLAVVLKTRSNHTGPIWLMLAGLTLSLGLLLRWNGKVVQHPAFGRLDAVIWRMGHFLKPDLFPTSSPTSYFETGLPLPGLVLTALTPFWESARTVSRYAIAGMLGAVALARMALERLPRIVRYLLIGIWIIELWPAPTGNVPVPYRLHPAYAWLAEQPLEAGEGIVDLRSPTLQISGEITWASWLHQKPTASGMAPFLPEHTFGLWYRLLNDREALARPQIRPLLRQYGIRYLFLHMHGDKEKEMWEMVRENPALHPLRCFEPLKGPTPWPYPICVAEVENTADRIQIMLLEGWSGREDWGIWAEGLRSRAGWLETGGQSVCLHIGAFPLCVPGRRQWISIRVNGREIVTHQWENCELWEEELHLPASFIREGWNELVFEYGYAFSPAEITQGENPDPRILSVGFTKMEVVR